MSNCLIRIKIGNQEILIDPRNDISEDMMVPLANIIPADKLRLIYSQLKSTVNLDARLVGLTDDNVVRGRKLYNDIEAEEKSKGNFTTLLSTIRKEKDIDRLKALTAYANSLNGKEVLDTANYAIDAKESHKASPYSVAEIRNMVFKKDGDKVKLFDELMGLPGMETVKISVAYAEKWNGEPIGKVHGMYITPDNIIQIVIPSKKKGFQKIETNPHAFVSSDNIGNEAKTQVQNVLIHELMHAVYSELYQSDPNFKAAINAIHTKFLDALTKDTKIDPASMEPYKDVHEFLSSIFNEGKLQSFLSRIAIEEDVDLSPTLFQVFTKVLEDKVLNKKSILKEYIQLVGNNLPILGIDTVNDTRIQQELVQDRESIFYLDGLADAEFEQEAAPRDQYDSRYGVNKKAYYAWLRFNRKYNGITEGTDKKETFNKDLYYKTAITNPTTAQIDRLYADDIVILPWMKYIKATKDKSGKWLSAGKWVEVGMLTDSKGEPVKTAEGKNRIEPIERDENGKIKPRLDGFAIKEMSQSFPVMYSNIKKGQVVVAKLKLPKTAENPKSGDNNVLSFPYHLIKGIRKLDHSYFNHNEDYDVQLKKAEAELDKLKRIKGNTGKKADSMDFYEAHIQRLEGYVAKAADIKREIVELNKKYAFRHKDIDGKIYMNVSKEDYLKSGYSQENLDDMVFAEKPVFRMNVSNYPSKTGGNKGYTYPNPELFHLFWEQSGLGKEYAKTSEQMGEAIAPGDLVRAVTTVHFGVKDSPADTATTKMGKWFTVHRRVANGVICTTSEGVGYFVPFNQMTGYAKNKNTDEYKLLLASYHNQIVQFEDDVYNTSSGGKRTFNKEYVTFKALHFNKEYNVKEGEEEEDAIKRFEGNLQRLKHNIKPNYSFVRMTRRFLTKTGERRDMFINGLVLAKTDEAVVVLTENQTGMYIETVRFDQKIAPKDDYGYKLDFLMENSAEVKEVWDEYQKESEEYEKNKKVANFLNQNGVWTKVNEPALNPHHIKDVYDFYEVVNGVTIARVKKGDIVGVRMNFEAMTPEERAKYKSDFYYRKVVRVLDDGTVVVADYNKVDKELKGGFRIKAGTVFPRYLSMDKIAKIGVKLGPVTQGDDKEYHALLNEDLMNRRKKLWENAKADRDFQSFQFAASRESAEKTNAKPAETKFNYWRFVPLTNHILEPIKKGETEKRPTVYYDKDFNEVPLEKAAYVKAVFHKGTTTLKSVIKGMNATTKMIYADICVYLDAKGYPRFKQELLDEVRVGDWVTTKNAAGQWWDALIERIEGDQLHVLNTDFTTQPVNMRKVVGVRFSNRNEKYSGFNRAPDLIAKLSGNAQKIKARVEYKAAQKAKKSKGSANRPYSLEANYKSPKSSRRALIEMGNRLQKLNPDININYVNQEELRKLEELTGHNYANARAFVLNGEVFINLEKASVSDVIHEYAHLFLHTLKYENTAMYDAIISVTNKHSLYSDIANDYKHLDREDLDEEVFVTVLGEYMYGKLSSQDKDNMDENKDLLLEFAGYTKLKLSQALNRTIESIYDLDPREIFNLSIEDVINLVGDDLMKNKISEMHTRKTLQYTKDIDKLKHDLFNKGLLTQECYE